MGIVSGNILVVDDTEENLRILVEALGNKGYKVRPALNGQIALKAARKETPDLILLDIIMPGMDGYQVCDALKADKVLKDVPVIFISALDEVGDKVKGFSAGGVDYISKPFQMEEVLARVKTQLTLRHLRKELEEKNIRLQQTNESLRKSEEKYRSMMESMDDSVYICSPDYHVEYMNPAMVKMVGRDAVGELCYKVLHELDEKCPWCVHDKVQQGENHVIETDRPRDNRTYNVSHFPIHNSDGSISKLTIFRDITEIKDIEHQLQQAQKMEAIGTLTGGIAHDYNNLMSIIMGNLSMAMDEAEPGSLLGDYLDQANTASHKVRDLTHELMTLSRGGAPVREVGSLDEFLKSASNFIPADSGISLNESFSQDLMQVPYDPYKMGAVLKNVVNNAVEAMPDGGIIRITAENLRIDGETQDPGIPLKPGDYVHISIQDQGKGILEKHLDQIFDPYFSTKEMGVRKGMGLGLATAYATVQKHGGHIAIDSSPGVGTTVDIYLPAEAQPQEIESEITSVADKAVPLKRVLVMDDEEMLRTLAQKMLERLGYEVKTVSDGVEAIDAYDRQKDSSEPFDSAILDLTIKGGMGGEQTIRELLKIDPHIKAIVCSGYFNDPVMSNFQEYGFKGALSKPYDKKKLKEALEKLFG